MSDRNTGPEQGDWNIRHLLHRVGHYAWYLVIALNVESVIVDTVLDAPSAVGLVNAIVNLGVFIVAMAGVLVHRLALCEQCIAAMPLNGPAKAETWRRTLATLHALLPRWPRPADSYAIPALIALVVCLAVAVPLMWVLPPEHATRWVLSPLLNVGMAVFAVAAIRHDLVMPWCPYCRWDEGGGREPSPVVPPNPVVSR